MDFKYKFMNKKSTSNKIENDQLNLNNEDEYNILITRLKELGSIIALLDKQYLDNLNFDKN